MFPAVGPNRQVPAVHCYRASQAVRAQFHGAQPCSAVQQCPLSQGVVLVDSNGPSRTDFHRFSSNSVCGPSMTDFHRFSSRFCGTTHIGQGPREMEMGWPRLGETVDFKSGETSCRFHPTSSRAEQLRRKVICSSESLLGGGLLEATCFLEMREAV